MIKIGIWQCQAGDAAPQHLGLKVTRMMDRISN